MSPERGGKIPAIALTADARVEDRTKALTAGFHMKLEKGKYVHATVEPA